MVRCALTLFAVKIEPGTIKLKHYQPSYMHTVERSQGYLEADGAGALGGLSLLYVGRGHIGVERGDA